MAGVKKEAKRARSSSVWDLFEYGPEKARCKACGTLLSHSGGSTSSMWSHYRRFHGGAGDGAACATAAAGESAADGAAAGAPAKRRGGLKRQRRGGAEHGPAVSWDFGVSVAELRQRMVTSNRIDHALAALVDGCLKEHGSLQRWGGFLRAACLSEKETLNRTATSGQCQFSSLADQLFYRPSSAPPTPTPLIRGDFRPDVFLRHLAVETIRCNESHYGAFLLSAAPLTRAQRRRGGSDVDMKEYLRRMSDLRCDGDHLTLQALCDALRMRVRVLRWTPLDLHASGTNFTQAEPWSRDTKMGIVQCTDLTPNGRVARPAAYAQMDAPDRILWLTQTGGEAHFRSLRIDAAKAKAQAAICAAMAEGGAAEEGASKATAVSVVSSSDEEDAEESHKIAPHHAESSGTKSPAPAEGAGEAPAAPPVCAVCLEAVGRSELAFPEACGHAFHRSCLLQWAEVSPKCDCPLCRTNFSAVRDADGVLSPLPSGRSLRKASRVAAAALRAAAAEPPAADDGGAAFDAAAAASPGADRRLQAALLDSLARLTDDGVNPHTRRVQRRLAQQQRRGAAPSRREQHFNTELPPPVHEEPSAAAASPAARPARKRAYRVRRGWAHGAVRCMEKAMEECEDAADAMAEALPVLRELLSAADHKKAAALDCGLLRAAARWLRRIKQAGEEDGADGQLGQVLDVLLRAMLAVVPSRDHVRSSNGVMALLMEPWLPDMARAIVSAWGRALCL